MPAAHERGPLLLESGLMSNTVAPHASAVPGLLTRTHTFAAQVRPDALQGTVRMTELAEFVISKGRARKSGNECSTGVSGERDRPGQTHGAPAATAITTTAAAATAARGRAVRAAAAAHHSRSIPRERTHPKRTQVLTSVAGPRARVEHQAGRRACTPHARLGSARVLMFARWHA